jgi:hypothetical protein
MLSHPILHFNETALLQIFFASSSTCKRDGIEILVRKPVVSEAAQTVIRDIVAKIDGAKLSG